jgi:hypothetical protein
LMIWREGCSRSCPAASSAFSHTDRRLLHECARTTRTTSVRSSGRRSARS